MAFQKKFSTSTGKSPIIIFSKFLQFFRELLTQNSPGKVPNSRKGPENPHKFFFLQILISDHETYTIKKLGKSPKLPKSSGKSPFYCLSKLLYVSMELMSPTSSGKVPNFRKGPKKFHVPKEFHLIFFSQFWWKKVQKSPILFFVNILTRKLVKMLWKKIICYFTVIFLWP